MKRHKNHWAVAVRKDADGNYFAMWLSFDSTFDLTEFFAKFVTARVCETKTEAVVAAAEANAEFKARGLQKEA